MNATKPRTRNKDLAKADKWKMWQYSNTTINGNTIPATPSSKQLMPEIIQNEVNGYICDNVAQMREKIELLISNKGMADKISKAGRETAIELFGKRNIAKQWKEFLEKGVSK